MTTKLLPVRDATEMLLKLLSGLSVDLHQSDDGLQASYLASRLAEPATLIIGVVGPSALVAAKAATTLVK